VKLYLHLKLKSDTTFGRGDGIPGVVDEEVEHDHLTGLPFLRGKTLKGLLTEECANLLFALQASKLDSVKSKVEEAANYLFGQGGSGLHSQGHLRISAARLPKSLCDAVEYEIAKERLTSNQMLESLTAIRRQTAIEAQTGSAEIGSLRAIRVILRETEFVSDLSLPDTASQDALQLLAACAQMLHRAGTSRNRGRGRLCAWLANEDDKSIFQDHLAAFYKMVEAAQ
jgi:hypothetical protein